MARPRSARCTSFWKSTKALPCSGGIVQSGLIRSGAQSPTRPEDRVPTPEGRCPQVRPRPHSPRLRGTRRRSAPQPPSLPATVPSDLRARETRPLPRSKRAWPHDDRPSGCVGCIHPTRRARRPRSFLFARRRSGSAGEQHDRLSFRAPPRFDSADRDQPRRPFDRRVSMRATTSTPACVRSAAARRPASELANTATFFLRPRRGDAHG